MKKLDEVFSKCQWQRKYIGSPPHDVLLVYHQENASDVTAAEKILSRRDLEQMSVFGKPIARSVYLNGSKLYITEEEI